MRDYDDLIGRLRADSQWEAVDAIREQQEEIRRLREDKEFQYEQRKIMFAQLQKNFSTIGALKDEIDTRTKANDILREALRQESQATYERGVADGKEEGSDWERP